MFSYMYQYAEPTNSVGNWRFSCYDQTPISPTQMTRKENCKNDQWNRFHIQTTSKQAIKFVTMTNEINFTSQWRQDKCKNNQQNTVHVQVTSKHEKENRTGSWLRTYVFKGKSTHRPQDKSYRRKMTAGGKVVSEIRGFAVVSPSAAKNKHYLWEIDVMGFRVSEASFNFLDTRVNGASNFLPLKGTLACVCCSLFENTSKKMSF